MDAAPRAVTRKPREVRTAQAGCRTPQLGPGSDERPGRLPMAITSRTVVLTGRAACRSKRHDGTFIGLEDCRLVARQHNARSQRCVVQWIFERQPHGCDHTSTNAPDPIRTPQLIVTAFRSVHRTPRRRAKTPGSRNRASGPPYAPAQARER
ncbi:hypothetical protein ACLOJK_024297 [Asimina triloba]